MTGPNPSPNLPHKGGGETLTACGACGSTQMSASRACPVCGAWSTAELRNVKWRPAESAVQRQRRSYAPWAALVIPLFAGILAGWAARPEESQRHAAPPVVTFADEEVALTMNDEQSEEKGEVTSVKTEYSKKQGAIDLPWASKLNLKIEKKGMGRARTYAVQDGKYYLYVTTIRPSNRTSINLSPTVAGNIEALGPYFVVIEPPDAGDFFVIPGKILSVEIIKKFHGISGSSSTRYAHVRVEGRRTFLRAGELEVDITPYKNAFHLLKP